MCESKREVDGKSEEEERKEKRKGRKEEEKEENTKHTKRQKKKGEKQENESKIRYTMNGMGMNNVDGILSEKKKRSSVPPLVLATRRQSTVSQFKGKERWATTSCVFLPFNWQVE